MRAYFRSLEQCSSEPADVHARIFDLARALPAFSNGQPQMGSHKTPELLEKKLAKKQNQMEVEMDRFLAKKHKPTREAPCVVIFTLKALCELARRHRCPPHALAQLQVDLSFLHRLLRSQFELTSDEWTVTHGLINEAMFSAGATCPVALHEALLDPETVAAIVNVKLTQI